MGEESLNASKQMETGQKKQGRHSTMDKMKERLHFNKKWRREHANKIKKGTKKIVELMLPKAADGNKKGTRPCFTFSLVLVP